MASGALPVLHAHGPSGRGEEPAHARRHPEKSVLCGVVQRERETFVARAQARERPVPRFVERELRGFLRCGILAYGFVRVHCDACGRDRVVAFSCKGRGFCPSCGGRRMADTAAHLVDRVLPEVPVRQWVLSLPFALRYRLAYDAALTAAVLGVFARAVFASLRRRGRAQWGVARGQCGAVTFVQRFGGALNLNVHFHSLLLDGDYAPGPDGALRFRPLPPPEDAEVERVVTQVARRIARLLERRGLGPEADPTEADPLAEDEPLLARLYGASVAGRIATGRRAGRRVQRVGDGIAPEDLPALATARNAWPSPDRPTPRPRRLAWSSLLRRVFAVDVLACPRCGGRMRVLAAIHPPDATQAILACLDLPSRAPPTAPPLADGTEGADGSQGDFDAAV